MYGKDYKYLRFKYYISQDVAARIAGISRHTLSIYEAGRSEVPLTVALKLNKLFDLTEAEVDKYMMK